jgi:hypothetical protein
MTLAHGVGSGANCVAEPGRLRNFENRRTLPSERYGFVAGDDQTPTLDRRCRFDLSRRTMRSAAVYIHCRHSNGLAVTWPHWLGRGRHYACGRQEMGQQRGCSNSERYHAGRSPHIG